MCDRSGQLQGDRAHMRLARILVVLCCGLGYLTAALLVDPEEGVPVYAQGSNQIGLVIYKGDGQPVTRCIEFGESELSGYDVLQRSGLDLSIEGSGMGASICGIDGTGCRSPEQSCFCGMENGKADYWSYWQLRDGQWTYSSRGASQSVIQPGMVEGWRWGPGNVAGATPPPPLRFEDICQVATPTLPRP